MISEINSINQERNNNINLTKLFQKTENEDHSQTHFESNTTLSEKFNVTEDVTKKKITYQYPSRLLMEKSLTKY